VGDPANLFGCCSASLLSNYLRRAGAGGAADLPDDWKGGFVLLWMIFVLSSFLTNIAAALIGGTIGARVSRQGAYAIWRDSSPRRTQAARARVAIHTR